MTKKKAAAMEFIPPIEFEPPPPKEYISAEQKMGGDPCASEIYNEVFDFLKACKCEKAVSAQLVESYAQTLSRHIQCEKIISDTGFLSKHPTTGEPITTPFIKMSLDYLRAAKIIWKEIYAVVRDNTARGAVPNAKDLMAKFLSRDK